MAAIDATFDNHKSATMFFGMGLLSVVGGLALGAFIDNVVRNMQKDDDDWRSRKLSKAYTYFFVQSFINIGTLFILTKISDRFVPWLQLTVAGALFAVLLFTTQRNLVDNVLRITNF